jgi:hypothetical protein
MAVFPKTVVTATFAIFVPFSLSLVASIPLAIVPSITIILVPFAVVTTRYTNDNLCERARGGEDSK